MVIYFKTFNLKNIFENPGGANSHLDLPLQAPMITMSITTNLLKNNDVFVK